MTHSKLPLQEKAKPNQSSALLALVMLLALLTGCAKTIDIVQCPAPLNNPDEIIMVWASYKTYSAQGEWLRDYVKQQCELAVLNGEKNQCE